LPSGIEIRDGRKTHALHGLGGIGKTQLAIAYARKHQVTYSAILWLNGNSKNTLLQSLAAFGRHAEVSGLSQATATTTQREFQDVEAEAQAVLRWLALKENHQGLMIIDNVDREHSPDVGDPQAYDIEWFLPPADHGFVLITTRLSSLSAKVKPTEIGRLNLTQALELLSDRSGLPRSTKGTRNICCHKLLRHSRLTELS